MGVYYSIYAEARVGNKWYNISPLMRNEDGEVRVRPVMSGQSMMHDAVEELEEACFMRGRPDNLSDELRLPEGLTELGDSAFEGCTSLVSVTLPESLETVGDCAFADCPSLREITVGSGVKRIGADMVVNTAATIKYTGNREDWFAVINRDAMKGTEPYTVICRDGFVKYE